MITVFLEYGRIEKSSGSGSEAKATTTRFSTGDDIAFIFWNFARITENEQ